MALVYMGLDDFKTLSLSLSYIYIYIKVGDFPSFSGTRLNLFFCFGAVREITGMILFCSWNIMASNCFHAYRKHL